jgi:hypothetical protein
MTRLKAEKAIMPFIGISKKGIPAYSSQVTATRPRLPTMAMVRDLPLLRATTPVYIMMIPQIAEKMIAFISVVQK